MVKTKALKYKTTDGTKIPVCRSPRILRRLPNNVKCPTPALKPGLGTHESGPRAGDIGYPKWLKSSFVKNTFFHPALLLKGLHLLAEQL